MISFIVIGRNEEKHLKKCIKSIYASVESNKIDEYEIIYVDSNSSDKSVETAKQNGAHRIFKLTEKWNAAIGRNIGAKFAKGDILCFLDGDMELVSSFVPHIMDIECDLKYDVAAGDLFYKIYNDKDEVVCEKRLFAEIKKTMKKPITGGAFWIKKQLYDKVNGMDNRFRRAADPELGLRLAKKGYLLTFIPELFVIHNTEQEKPRSILDLLKFNWVYGSILTYKFNLLNKYTYRRMIKHDNSFIVLVLSILLAICCDLRFIGMYLVWLSLRSKLFTNKNSFSKWFYYLFRDVLTLIFFIPLYIKRIKTEEIYVEEIVSKP